MLHLRLVDLSDRGLQDFDALSEAEKDIFVIQHDENEPIGMPPPRTFLGFIVEQPEGSTPVIPTVLSNMALQRLVVGQTRE